MQRSWIILLTTCIFFLPIYIFATPILRMFGEDEAIAVHAGRFSLYMLEYWNLMFLIIMVGLLKNAQIAVAAISICINLHGWEIMIFIGFNAAISVRVSNELGARRTRAAKFSVLIVPLTTGLIGLIFFTTMMALRKVYAIPFTNNPEVVRVVAHLILVFCSTLLSDSVGPVVAGVAVGAGCPALVAYINLGCYYVVGIPLGYLLAFKLDLGVEVVINL
ncbi:Protein TRANSPARENT TESTA 12 [Platanthera guangdongensis]|uniref:Protein TRANSPARENT TESTA 12 n=1 Tax=Platanthera guangdongensis TaxID=2320717 RepID=A0ABR2MP91_9ASPA